MAWWWRRLISASSSPEEEYLMIEKLEDKSRNAHFIVQFLKMYCEKTKAVVQKMQD